MVSHILYLGSKSKARQRLLDVADIPYQVLGHDADECSVQLSGTFEEYVLAIAQEKMRHVKLPSGKKVLSTLFVLTADTLLKTERSNQILGKPKDKADAKRMLHILQNESAYVVTGCCLEKKELVGGEWKTIDHAWWISTASVEFCVPEEDIAVYLEKVPLALHGCGSGIIEGYGQNFLKSINGSYTAVLGLPMYELRSNLKNMGFFS